MVLFRIASRSSKRLFLLKVYRRRFYLRVRPIVARRRIQRAARSRRSYLWKRGLMRCRRAEPRLITGGTITTTIMADTVVMVTTTMPGAEGTEGTEVAALLVVVVVVVLHHLPCLLVTSCSRRNYPKFVQHTTKD